MSEDQSPAWTVYIVECKDRTLYTGIAKDVDQRVQAHNDGKGAKYTAGRRPVTLLYQEQALDRGAAQAREYAIKRLNARQKRALSAP
ncbi:MAG: GIY-YIG nuclease family protein [Gammaproteobacteria bacterium]